MSITCRYQWSAHVAALELQEGAQREGPTLRTAASHLRAAGGRQRAATAGRRRTCGGIVAAIRRAEYGLLAAAFHRIACFDGHMSSV
jgi:hypothetical protein